MSKTPIAIQAKRNLLHKDPPLAAHQFGFSRVGTDIVLEVGTFDVTALGGLLAQAQKEGKSTVEAELNIAQRFSLTPQGALSLFETAQKLVLDLQNAGMIKLGQKQIPMKTGGMD